MIKPKDLKNKKWLRSTFDADINPILMVLDIILKEQEIFKQGRGVTVYIFENGLLWMSLDEEGIRRLGKKIVMQELKTGKYFDYIAYHFYTEAKDLRSLFLKQRKEKLSNFSSLEILSKLKNLLNKLSELLAWSINAEGVTMYIQDQLNLRLQNIKQENKNLLVQPLEPTLVKQENLDMMSLCVDIINKGIDKNNFKKSIKNKDIAKLFIKHQQKYYWLRNTFGAANDLPVEHFQKEALDMLEKYDWNKDSITKELAIQENNYRNVKPIKQKIIKENNIDETSQKLLHILERYVPFHDLRKALFIETTSYSAPLVDILRERFKIDPELFKAYYIKELEELIKTGRKVSGDKLIKRNKLTAAIYAKKGFLFVGQKALEYKNAVFPKINETKILKGVVASPGEIKGIAKILLSTKEGAKLNVGDILVATNTSPEFVPFMKKAAAILTEKGGLTSHAAIVSRELGIPCIVGIKNITSIIKDGDLIEVDADKGIIKLIK